MEEVYPKNGSCIPLFVACIEVWSLRNLSLCNQGPTSVGPQKAERKAGLYRLRIDSSEGNSQWLCNQGTTLVGPIKPIISTLGFSPCKTSLEPTPWFGFFSIIDFRLLRNAPKW